MPLLDRRIGLLFLCFGTLLAVAFVRSLWFGTVKGDALTKAAATQQVKPQVIPAHRGSITDRHGVELAVSEPASDVSATPYLVENPVKAGEKLAPILGVSSEKLTKELARRDTGFVYLKRELPAAKADRVAKLALAGITLTPVERREYPRTFMASQVLGSVGTDDQGLSGVEYAHDKQLAGEAGERRVVRDALGRVLELKDVQPATPGADLELTLDSAIQDKAEQVLAGVGAKYSPKGASAIVMDPSTNEVLAMANWPRVDANALGDAPMEARQNRAVQTNYEPGSTFKTVAVSGALEDGRVTPDTEFVLQPKIQVADRLIGESHERGTVTLSTAEILAQSSNVGAITIARRLGDTKLEAATEFDRWLRKFGFAEPTGIDLPGEEKGQVLPVSKYSGSSMGNLPIGQGESVTPLQMATAYSAIANGGILRAPRIVRRVDGKLVARPKGKRIVSATVAAQVRAMLKGVVAPGGTAQEVAIKGYALAGKTGTANKIDPKTGLYSESAYVASFAGFAPADKPRLLISVMVDEPQGQIYGAQVAAPAFGRIASFALQSLRIPPD